MKPASEESYKLGASLGRVRRVPIGGEAYYLLGDVVTKCGIVSVASDSTPYSRYDVAIRGRHYMRTERVQRTERGLAIEAAKFARRIATAR